MVLATVLGVVGLGLPATAVPSSLGMDVTAPAFVGELFLAQSDAMPTPGGRDNWTCHVDFGDGTTGGFWRAHSYDSLAPCAEFHDLCGGRRLHRRHDRHGRRRRDGL